ncbi:MAG: C39 family peptidase [Candidatus Brachytrichaceae bacterium NZ_4S206]
MIRFHCTVHLLWACYVAGLVACASPTATSEPPPQISVTYYPTTTPTAQPTPIVNPLPKSEDIRTQTADLIALIAPSPTPAPAFPLPAASALLAGIRHEQQTWNNCGPATVSMLLSYFGRTETQRQAARFLKPDREDKNVSPDELAAYAQSLGFEARVIAGGDLSLIRTFVANGLPVIVETWFIPEPNDEMGHYQLVIGYDEDELIFYDSYQGPDVRAPVAQFDPLWKVFNRTMMVAYTAPISPLVEAILGERADERVMYERALAQAQAEAAADPRDKFAWFNIGTNLLALGDAAGAAEAFDKARALKLPWRMMWYQFGPYVAYFEQGRYADVIELANATLRRVRNLEESLYWRGRALAAIGNVKAARADFQAALRFNPHYAAAREALDAIGMSR